MLWGIASYISQWLWFSGSFWKASMTEPSGRRWGEGLYPPPNSIPERSVKLTGAGSDHGPSTVGAKLTRMSVGNDDGGDGASRGPTGDGGVDAGADAGADALHIFGVLGVPPIM